MNIKDRLNHLAAVLVKDRMMGRTTLNARMAKESGGMVIAADIKEAKRIERSFGVPARSMETNLDGYSAPFFMDHFATSRMMQKAANKIELLEQTLKAEREEKDLLLSEVEQLKETVKRLQSGAV